MLVLSRKLGESVEIGDKKVIVRVLGIRRSKVQLGVEAPPEVAVHRSEKAEHYRSEKAEQYRSLGAPLQASSSHDAERTRRKPSRRPQRRQPQDRQPQDRQPQDHQPQDHQPRGNPGSTPVRSDDGSQRARSRHDEPADAVLGRTLLDDLARVHAEIAALAELASLGDRVVARQVAAEATERLAAIERTLQFIGRRTGERPIAAFVDARSAALQMKECREATGSPRGQDGQSWNERRDQSVAIIRESNATFAIGVDACSVA